MPSPTRLPSPTELAAAAGRTIPDVLGDGLAVLFVGINPGLVSGATGHHFARPGNRFWPVLHAAGFTPRLLRPDEQDELPALGLGITNLVARTTATAAELTDEELRAGATRLAGVVAARRPRFVAFLGLTTYRVAFGRRDATVGEQPEPLEGARTWVLPNPSGLNAGWSRERLTEAYTALRRAALPRPGDLPPVGP
ncbi:MAG: G/U mismatch-specific DNA glycosylase [Chloroflexota bacterium]